MVVLVFASQQIGTKMSLGEPTTGAAQKLSKSDSLSPYHLVLGEVFSVVQRSSQEKVSRAWPLVGALEHGGGDLGAGRPMAAPLPGMSSSLTAGKNRK
jgi:hypothetical protein